MSYHFTIKNTGNISYARVLQNGHIPHDTQLSFGVKPDEIVSGYSKFYLPQLSSRGVAVTTTPHKYDVEINTGATKDDYLLAVKIALALAELNGVPITPEFDDTIPVDEFSERYNEAWAQSVRHMGIDSMLQLIIEGHTEGVKFMGCIRDYYMGAYTIDALTTDNPSKETFNERLIEEIRKMQFLEDYEEDIVFPTLMIATFPDEGEKKIMILPVNEKALVQKCDYIILHIIGGMMVRVTYDEFRGFIAARAKRADEDSYIIDAIGDVEYAAIIAHFKALQDAGTNQGATGTPIQTEEIPDAKPETHIKSWWQFWK